MNRALVGAMRKGLAAKAAGAPESVCPYLDKRKHDGRLTWSRAFERAWVAAYRGDLTETDKRALGMIS